MNITAEEKLMYEVMKAIYDSGIPVSFKGSMVLKACLMEAGYPEETRHTVDIDANWNSDTSPSAEQMVASLQDAIAQNGIELDVSLYRMYGEGRSAGFELTDQKSGEILFSMDVDVNRPISPTKIYEVAGLHFRGVAPSQMIADKVAAVSSDKVFRRVKDVVDLFYLSKVFDFDKDDVLERLKESNRELGDFHGFLHRTDELHHSYEKFRFAGDVGKPPFEEVYAAEQPIANYKSNAFPEVANTLVLDGHTLGAIQLVITDMGWAKLTEQQQAWIMEAGKLTQEYNAQIVEEAENEVLEALKAEGCNIVEITDKAPWVEACQEVITANTSDQAELYATLVGLQ